MNAKSLPCLLSIHPPYPFESEMKGDDAVTEEDVPHNAVICGALLKKLTRLIYGSEHVIFLKRVTTKNMTDAKRV